MILDIIISLLLMEEGMHKSYTLILRICVHDKTKV